jgi:hypothetical protein
MKLYGVDKRITALVFHFEIEGRRVAIRVPANAEGCYQTLLKEHRLKVRRMNPGTEERIREQANRTAWRLVQDWVDVQISMIVMRQAEFLEVFLPYVWDGKQTLFESFKGGGFKALPATTSEAL